MRPDDQGEHPTPLLVRVGVPRWGETETTTVARPVSQPPCEERGGSGSGGGGASGSDGDHVCMVDVTYELESGDILEYELLSCWEEDA